MLKKDVKKITMERDGALKHLSLTTGIYVLTLLHSQIYSISLVTLIATFSTKLVCMYTCAFLFVCWGRPVTSREIWFLYYTRSILCTSTITAPSFYYMYFSLESLPLKAKKYTKSTFSGNMELGGHHHHRTASDTASGTSSTSAKPGNVHQISFWCSSILASRDTFQSVHWRSIQPNFQFKWRNIQLLAANLVDAFWSKEPFPMANPKSTKV